LRIPLSATLKTLTVEVYSLLLPRILFVSVTALECHVYTRWGACKIEFWLTLLFNFNFQIIISLAILIVQFRKNDGLPFDKFIKAMQ